MSALELVAASLGVISVYLTARQHWLCWPIGAIMVALYAVIFYEAKLYADMGLQVVYFYLQFFGWYQWLRGGSGHSVLRVSRSSPALTALLLVAGSIFALALGWALAHHTDASLPYIDAAITGFSLVAQYMMARKKIENWLVWFAVDSVAIVVFYHKQLYATAVLYGIFLLLCIVGYRHWQRDLKAG